MATIYSLNRTAGPSAEPVSRSEAKKQIEIASGVTDHDAAIDNWIIAAREQVEHDTGYALMTQTYTLALNDFERETIQIPIKPVQSVSSITYFDAVNAQVVLSTDVYGLDSARRLIYLKYNQNWPTHIPQHNGVVITLVAGYGSAANVPVLFKQAILLQVAKWFQHRGDESQMSAHDTAYEKIINRVMRTGYP